VAWIAVVGMSGCASRTELLIGVITDLKAPDALDTVQLTVTRTRDGFVEASVPWTLSGEVDQPFNLPGSYGLSADHGGETLQLDLLGFKGSAQLVARTSILSVVDGQTLFYRMALTAGCASLGDCGSGMTCVEGTCKDVHVDATTFPSFSGELVDELTCNSGVTYLDTDTGTPMTLSSDAAACPNNLCTEGTCYVPPQPSSNACRTSGLYTMTFNCTGECAPGIPGSSQSVLVDQTPGVFQFGFGSGQPACTSDTFLAGDACTEAITCPIDMPGGSDAAIGMVTGDLDWDASGTSATGTLMFTCSTQFSCNVTLAPG
jgi:hypothetical protein